jgi:hypothetical protein
MTCDIYWRDGIVLVERGLDDPHREGCADCARAHASRQELVEALPLIGASYTGDPHWQAKVWRRIDGEVARPPWRWRWQLAGAAVVAGVVALWIGLGRHDELPRFEIGEGAVAMRSAAASDSANVGAHLRVTVDETSEVWIYRDKVRVRHCRARQVSDSCAPDPRGMIVEMVLSNPGKYQVLVVAAPVPPSRGGLDEDRAALESTGAKVVERLLRVH